jgi:hypothetical protein
MIHFRFEQKIIFNSKLSKNLQFLKFDFGFLVSLLGHSYKRHRKKEIVIFFIFKWF